MNCFINYVILRNQKFMSKVEHETDLLTIKKGYGKELLEATLIREKKLKTQKSRRIRDRYMSSKEIKQEMKKLNKKFRA